MRLLAALLALVLAAPARAALNTGAAFLKLDPSARSAAMGSAYSAASGSADTVFFNPAGLAGLGKRELMAGHAEWVAGTKFDALAYGQPTTWGSLGVSAMRLSVGELDARTADRRAAGSFEAADSVYALSGARRFSAATFGASLKYLKSEIGPYSAQTFAVDLGARKEVPGRPLSFGLAVRNLGKGLRFLDQEDALPLMVSAGASYRLAGVLGLALDVGHEPHESRTSVSVGTEYSFLGSLALRAGYGANTMSRSSAKQGALGGLGAGLGLKFRSFGADYAFTPFGELGDVQRLSLSAKF
ncbi:MAG: PorV/PorQ family protein [Elusimicrobia bacterium]|nr:PorV/PorQ family protein [Elusimicrobiota bacterium]